MVNSVIYKIQCFHKKLLIKRKNINYNEEASKN